MANEIENVIEQLGVILGVMDDLERWYDDPPESISEFPCGLAYVESGEIKTVSSGWGQGLHTFRVALYLNRQVLPDAVDAAKPWPYRVFAALAAEQTLNGTVDAILWPLTYRVGPLAYGKDTHLGILFTLGVKINAAVTTAA